MQQWTITLQQQDASISRVCFILELFSTGKKSFASGKYKKLKTDMDIDLNYISPLLILLVGLTYVQK